MNTKQNAATKRRGCSKTLVNQEATMSKNTLIAIIVILAAGLGYYIYQDQQKEQVSLSIGDKSISIEAQ